jgi:branched-chain amino acid transport system permease protein
MDAVLIQVLNGLASASSLFLVASGLTVIFGVTRVVNFAHGSLYMLGAYVAWSLTTRLPRDPALFWAGMIAASLIVGMIGALIEMTILRRIYRAPELFQLLATFGVVLIFQDVTLAIWGAEDLAGPRAPGLRGAVTILGSRFPLYELLLIAIGPLVLGALWLLFQRTRWGILVRAATQDREMVAALGVDQRWLFTSVFLLGSILAAFGGALQIPRESANLRMDIAMIADVFVVTVVGGMGSVPGAFLAAVLIGELQALMLIVPPFRLIGVEIVPAKMTLIPSFIVMAVVLVLLPHGLLGRAPTHPRAAGGAMPGVIRAAPRPLVIVGVVALVAALILPPLAGDYALILATEFAIFVLFAASLHFVMGPGGLASFGHAAFFGGGAYAAALFFKHLGAPMEFGLIAAPIIAGALALLVGSFIVRLEGVYLAMLTLAFAQILWSAAFQWVAFTGGDNGVLGVWPAAWAANKLVFYLLALALCVGATLALRRVINAPFGWAMRAGRDNALRAEAIGIDVARIRFLAFGLSGAAAGLAGGLFAYMKGSVFPTYLAIPKSVDALLMVLLGGVDTLAGPIVGALVFRGLEEQLVRMTDWWRACLGIAIVAIVILFPQGIAGWARGRWERRA